MTLSKLRKFTFNRHLKDIKGINFVCFRCCSFKVLVKGPHVIIFKNIIFRSLKSDCV